MREGGDCIDEVVSPDRADLTIFLKAERRSHRFARLTSAWVPGREFSGGRSRAWRKEERKIDESARGEARRGARGHVLPSIFPRKVEEPLGEGL